MYVAWLCKQTTTECMLHDYVNKQLLNVCSMIMWTNNYWMYVAWPHVTNNYPNVCSMIMWTNNYWMYVAWLCEQPIAECMYHDYM